MSPDDRTRVREVLQRAAGRESPDVDRLVASVPALVARARRAAAADEPGGLGARAWGVLPRLAAATAAALVLAVLSGALGNGWAFTGSASAELDGLLPDDGEDVLLQAVTGEDGNDG